ncbi:MAG: hypothetical protein ACI8UO_004648 [Verrucomicrobiales bacterium]
MEETNRKGVRFRFHPGLEMISVSRPCYFGPRIARIVANDLERKKKSASIRAIRGSK